MTTEEIFKKYGDIELSFRHYYKYSFMFKGETPEGETVFAYIGGDADDIYRLDLDYNETGTISNLEPSSIRIMKGKEVVVDWDEY